MSVVIKSMQMPEDCRECRFQDYGFNTGDTWCGVNDVILAKNFRAIEFDGRPGWCPLVELPEHHGRLIDADELKTAFPRCDNNMDIKIASARATINHMPTIIEAERIKEVE